MTKSLDFYFDVGSPASYLAWTQIPAMASQYNATVHWKPILLGAVFKATGNSSPAVIPAKARYMTQDLKRYAKRYGVDFNFNPHFPVNTLHLMRGAMACLDSPTFPVYLTAVFNALWVDGKNMNDADVVAEVLTGAGIDPSAVFGAAQSDAVKEALKNRTEEAVARGVFGAPSIFVNDSMFFGQDRLEWVEAALAQQD